MKQVLIKKGQAETVAVPAPLVESGSILVQTRYSCISVGTEMSGIKTSGIPLWKQALDKPENIKKVIKSTTAQGISRTRQILTDITTSGRPTGYSAAGVVSEAVQGVTEFCKGDLVACAGAQCAYHAEVLCVPRNLAVKIPANVSFEAASTVTLGAIALQGIRRVMPTLGEAFVVIGLGVLGQLTVQMLKANGCRVMAVDVDQTRVGLALKMGADVAIHPDQGSDIEQVFRITGGIGADGVIITAATPSHEPLSQAFKMCRKKGRVVVVGDVGLNLNRADIYTKELDFFISTSYGPGRYDHNYEEKGLDYPVAWVRWTENRNMAEYLRLISSGCVSVDSMISDTYPIEQSTNAYAALNVNQPKPLMVLLSYPQTEEVIPPARIVENPAVKPAGKNRIRLAIIGAGAFAKSMHLPNLKSLSDLFYLQAVVSRSGHNARNTTRLFGARYASTDYRQVLNDPGVDAVLIATRHNSHAQLVLESLRAGKHVFVEKPLAIRLEELNAIADFYINRQQAPILLTGFNRRFSPYVQRIKEIITDRSNPMIIDYQMNAGHLPPDHWVHSAEGGGRNLGEACHIYDVFTFLTEAKISQVHTTSISPANGHYSHRDNFIATLKFEEGTVATLTYTALGSKDFPKEKLTVYSDDKVLLLDNYQNLTIYGARTKGQRTSIPNKGHKQEMAAFARAVQTGQNWPIPLWEQIQATEISFSVEASL
jgi:predicted dehydrogenase/threonine dehydrogenase-like Zn-dependent dehydrogenase